MEDSFTFKLLLEEPCAGETWGTEIRFVDARCDAIQTAYFRLRSAVFGNLNVDDERHFASLVDERL